MSAAGVGAELSVREATAGDTDRILGLVRTSLGEGPVPRDPGFWGWKHHRNPFGESPMLLAEADGVLVGLRAFMRWEWESYGRPVPAVRAVDTATHPDWQGRGIFRTLTMSLVGRMREDGVRFVFNTPNARSRPGYLKMGWGAVGRVDLRVRPLRPFRAAAVLARRGRAAALAENAEPAWSGPPAAELLAPGGEVAGWLDARPTDRDARLGVRRDARYLRWRYAEVPGFRYGVVAEIDGAEGALVAFRDKRQGALRELRVCDIVLGPGGRSRRAARALLGRIARESGADYVSAMTARGTAERRVVSRAGFLPAPRLGPILTVLPLNPVAGGVDPLGRSGWRASLGDLELF
jgi:GNAT superfamily N-acetyltransferase